MRQAYDHDDKVDQYEFLVASLIALGKLTSEDVRPIMDKFRDLAGNKGYISFIEDVHEENINDTESERIGEDEIDYEE